MANWIIIITISLATAVAKCELNLRIFENLDNVFVLVTNRTFEVTNEKNLSLTCKIFDSNVNDVIDDRIIWGRKGRGIKFIGDSSLSPNLNFTPIKLNNEGKYFCLSLKYGLYKIIFIIVRGEYFNGSVFLKRKRWKRGDMDSVTLLPDSFISTYYETTTVSRMDKLYPDNHHQPFDYSNNGYSSSSNRVHSRRKDYSYAGVITAIVAVILIIGAILYRLMKRLDILYAETPQQTTNVVEPDCQHPTCGQYCTLPVISNGAQNNICNLYHGVHMSNVNTINNSRISSPTTMQQRAHVSTDDQANPPTPDLPPSYDSFVKHFNSRYEPPPTYNEALRYITRNSYYVQDFNKTNM